MKKRKLEELNVMDDFLFHEMITRGEKGEAFCQVLLSTILGKDIPKVRVLAQKVIQGRNTDNHGIRLDTYLEEIPIELSGRQKLDKQAEVEVQSNIYDIEPTKYKMISEPKRSRYYNAMIDSRQLKSGADYSTLRNVVIIMILPYDPFSKDRMVYTIENQCIEDDSVEYDDGLKTIYLYTKGTQGNPSQELRDMLKYIEDSSEENAKSKELSEIHKLVNEIKKDGEVGINYMKILEWEDMLKKEGKSEGIEEGIAQGEELLSRLIQKLIELSRKEDINRVLTDKDYRERLYKELNIS